MEFLLGAIYALLCLLVGVLGRTTRLGFWGTAVASFVLTPLAVLLILVLFGPRRVPHSVS